MKFDEPTIKATQLTRALETRRIGRSIETFAQSASTNDLCWSRLDRPGEDADGYVAISDYQTAGRGRFNRAWLAPRASSLLMSTLIVQPTGQELMERISLIAGIAACAAACTVSEADIQLRWPNDLICQRRKVGGVLVEARPWRDTRVAVVIGIGINCLQHAAHFPPELQGRAASLDMVSPHAISRFDLAVALLQQLDRWLGLTGEQPADQVRSRWLELAEPLGQRVCMIHAGTRFFGTTVELDPAGGLLVQLESGGRRIFEPATTTMEWPHTT